MDAECVTEVGDVHDVHLHLQVAELAPALAALALMPQTLNPSWFLEFVVVVAAVGRGQAATLQWEMISKIVPLCVFLSQQGVLVILPRVLPGHGAHLLAVASNYLAIALGFPVVQAA